MKSFVPGEPIYLGFVGPAGVGKTATGQALAGGNGLMAFHGDDDPGLFPSIIWQHYWLSLPLYSIYNIRTETKGVDSQSRIMYGILEIVNSVMMKQISFDDMIEMVYDLYSLPITNEIGVKPRTFLQQAGDIFVDNYSEAIARYIKHKVYSDYYNLAAEYDRNDMDLTFIGVVSDIRYPHEAKVFKNQPNSILIKMEADKEILNQRLIDRDGFVLSGQEANHRTEQSFDLIPEEWYDYTVNTTKLSFENQVEMIKQFVLNQGVPCLS